MQIFKSALYKLTMLYVLIVMVVSIGFSIAIFQISSDELDRGFGRRADDLRSFQVTPPIKNSTIKNFEEIRIQRIDDISDNLQQKLIYFNLMILVLSFIGSYFFAKKTLKPVEEAFLAQNRFTSDASHELRTPLTAIRSEIEVGLRDKSFTISEAKKLLRSNLEEVEKLESMTTALLKLAKFDEKSNESFCKLDLTEILAGAYERVENLAKVKMIKFNNSFDSVEIHGDKDSLIELFVILLDNAIKYSPKNSTILIKIKKSGNHAIVSIKDKGLGIKAGDLPHIFERFYRADQSRNKEKVSGFGLGLSIAKRIVEMHSGSISIKSSPGNGSEFIVKL